MKFLTLTALAAAVVAVSATPAGHMNLAKRAAIATQTVVQDGTTYVQVVEGTVATTIGYTTVTKTVTATETDATYIFSYSGDDSSIVARLQSALSDIIAGDELPSDESSSSGIVDSLVSDVSSLASDLIDDVTSLAGDATSLAGGLVSDITSLAGDLVSDVTDAAGDLVSDAADAVGGIL